MQVIYKYQLQVADTQKLKLPVGFKILSLQVQDGVPCIWVLLDARSDEYYDCIITTLGAGKNYTYDMGSHIGTYQLHNGALVFHVFNRINN